MALCAQFVRIHHAWAQTSDRRTGERRRAAHSPERRKATQSRTILLVEDNESERTVIRTAIESLTSFAVHEAVNGADGIRKAIDLKPDLIIMDLAMPLMNGLEAASVIRNELPRVPVVVLTLYADELRAPRNKIFGVTRVLSKTDGLRPLMECLHKLLD